MVNSVSITVGIIIPGSAPVFTTRTVPYTDLSAPLSLVTTILTNPPFLQYLPIPEPEPEPLPQEAPL